MQNRQQIQQYFIRSCYRLEIDFIVSVNGSIRLLSIRAVEALQSCAQTLLGVGFCIIKLLLLKKSFQHFFG